MNNSQKSYSSGKTENTRVKSRKKQAKKTVGITLPPNIIKEARKHNLNISRVTEQALISILDYLNHQNKPESSKSLYASSLSRKKARAPVAQSVERQPRKLLVAGSNPARGFKSSLNLCVHTCFAIMFQNSLH